MSTSIVICDDSNMARKQVVRSLPENWSVEINFATNGVEGLEAIKKHQATLLFLDLNMPIMDGYQVLQEILKQGIEIAVIVISGDIQPESLQRVKNLGAIDFIKKPIITDKLLKVLTHAGLLESQTNEATTRCSYTQTAPSSKQTSSSTVKIQPSTTTKADPTTEPRPDHDLAQLQQNSKAKYDCYQEIVNVAMGRAGDLLARLLNVFVELPVPNVNLLEVGELSMVLSNVLEVEETSAICQGFIGTGIAGEALLVLNNSNMDDVAALMNYQQDESNLSVEMLMDLSNLLIGACLNGIANQLDISFTQQHPMVLGQQSDITKLIDSNTDKWQKTLAIEISFGIENHPIQCDLLLLFTESSTKVLDEKIAYLLES